MDSRRLWTTLASAALLLGGCGSGTSIQEENISDPGGFLEAERRLADPAEEDYCSAELLRWRHDPAAGSLKLADARLMLNCCGVRDLRVERIDSVYEVTEQDAPDARDGRCDAVCAFDFTVTIPGVPAETVYVKLLRDVTDAQGGPALVWQGELDLSRGAGSVALDAEDAGETCSETIQ